MTTYPTQAGHKATGTSEDAANSTNAGRLRGMVLAAFLNRPGSYTADEMAAHMGLSILSIRPRFSELRQSGSIVDTGLRSKNTSGKSAIVWRLNAPDQRPPTKTN
ncbi:MAG: hypothetical protein WCL08_00405 [Verrucomicrobiota bacterium]